jgi:hypothetical protein
MVLPSNALLDSSGSILTGDRIGDTGTVCLDIEGGGEILKELFRERGGGTILLLRIIGISGNGLWFIKKLAEGM